MSDTNYSSSSLIDSFKPDLSPSASTNNGPDIDAESIALRQQHQEVNDKLLYNAANLQAQEEDANAPNLIERVGNYALKGIPLTGAAIVNSFANTAIELGNWATGSDVQKLSIQNEFGEGSYNDYYNQNKGLIEGGAFAAGSLLPGLGAVKALKLAQVGSFGTRLQSITGVFSGISDAVIADAKLDAAGNATATSLFGSNLAAKGTALAAGVADEALQGGVYSLATLATMKASPLTDNNTIADDLHDVLSGALQGGIFGGVFRGVSTLGKIKSGILGAEATAKLQSLVNTQGLGNITPGDRLASLIEGEQSKPIPATGLQTKVQKFATDVVNRNFNNEINNLTGGDTEVSKVLGDFIKSSDLSDSELQAQNLGGLVKAGRINDENIRAIDNNVFYVPSHIDLNSAINNNDFSALQQPIAAPANKTQLAKALQLTNPNSKPVIGHALEAENFGLLTSLGNINALPKYKGALDAYNKGVDLFIDANGKTHINPNSGVFKEVARPGESRVLTKAERTVREQTGNLPAGAKPLNSTAVFLSVKDGKLLGEAPAPVVGDIGISNFGPKKIELQDGTEFNFAAPRNGQDFIQSLDPKNPLAANAEFTFFGKKGIMDQSEIDHNDLPKLDSLAQQIQEAGSPQTYLDDHEISILDDEGNNLAHISTPQDLLQHIADTKIDLAKQFMTQPDANTDVISKLINAPESFIANNGRFSSLTDLITPWKDSLLPNTLRLAYDITNTKDNVGNILRGTVGVNYRQQLANQANTDATSLWANKIQGGGQKAVDLAQGLKISMTADKANLYGAGEGLFSSANGGYRTLAQQVERVGAVVSKVILQQHSKINDFLNSPLSALHADQSAVQAWGNFIHTRHLASENYVHLDPTIAAKYGLSDSTVVLENSVKYKKGAQLDWDGNYLPQGFEQGSSTNTQALRSYYNLDPKVLAVEKAHQSLLNNRNDLRSNFLTAQGLEPLGYNKDVLYAPPINTARTPYFALVKQKDGYALGGTDGMHVITARNDAELQAKIAQLPDTLQAFRTKDNIADFKKAQGEYDFNRNFTSLKVKSDILRRGILNNLVPEHRFENLVNDLVWFHRNQETALTRDYTELTNAKLFSQLEGMGERFTTTAGSTFGNIGSGVQKALDTQNPYNSYIRTALGISSKDAYPFWNQAQQKLSSTMDQAYDTLVQTFGAQRRGLLSPQEAQKQWESVGLGNPLGSAMNSLASQKAYYGGLTNRLPEANILSKIVNTGNSILGKFIIRMDPWQQLVHASTLPIMTALEYQGASKAMQSLLSTTLPGTTTQVPTLSKLFYNAIKNLFADSYGPKKGQLAALYEKANVPRDELSKFHDVINNLSFPASPTTSQQWLDKLSKASDIAEKISGTKFVNHFSHFIVADMGRQLGEAGGLQGQDLVDNIRTFSNRVLGNYTAGQRGAIFHGPIGQAYGLFQSYQFNLMQQVFRNLEESNYKSLAMASALQSTVFGLQSLPGFQHLNALIQQHDGNQERQDIYGTAVSSLGKPTADFLLYGALSNLTGQALYQRGDINPRAATIIDPNPLNLPTVKTGIKIYQNIAQLASNIRQGGNVPASLMLALEHNGLSRPLTGLAEMMQGYVTGPSGNLIANITPSTGWSDLYGIANMSRILGARPLDEALKLDAFYRNSQAQAAEKDKIESLGQAFKTTLYNNVSSTPQELSNFAAEYAADGGNIKSFGRSVLDWTAKAHVPMANAVYKKFATDPRVKNAMTVMGGVPLPSYQSAQTETQAPNEEISQ